jgi:protein-disulfide isomerase
MMTVTPKTERRLLCTAAALVAFAACVLSYARLSRAAGHNLSPAVFGNGNFDIFGIAIEPIAIWWSVLLLFVTISGVGRRQWGNWSVDAWLSIPAVALMASLALPARTAVFGSASTALFGAGVLVAAAVSLTRPSPAQTVRKTMTTPSRIIASCLFIVGSAASLFAGSALKTTQVTWAANSSFDRPSIVAWWNNARRAAPSTPVFQKGDNTVKIVVFSDYQCPACKHAWQQQGIVQAYAQSLGWRVEYTLRDFPLDTSCNANIMHTLHPAACEAAIAVRMAPVSSRPTLERWLFEHQESLTSQEVIGHAISLLGISRDDYAMGRGAAIAAIRDDLIDGGALRVDSTPILFVDGVRIVGSVDARILEVVIDEIIRTRTAAPHSPHG